MRDATGWVSVHVHHAGDTDRLLLETVEPTVRRLAERGWVRDFFYVRYWNGGRHVRLRMRPTDPGVRDALIGAAVAELQERVARDAAGPVDDGEYLRVAEAMQRLHDEPALPLVPRGTVRVEEYVFEHDRYGARDPSVREAVETHFCDSTRIALGVVRNVERARRVNWALEAMALGGAAIPGGAAHRAEVFRGFHASGWRGPALEGRTPPDLGYHPYDEVRETVLGFVRACETERATPAPRGTSWRASWRRSIGATVAAVASSAGEAKGAAALVSMLHMLNNRIGLSLPDELYLAWVLGQAHAEHAAGTGRSACARAGSHRVEEPP